MIQLKNICRDFQVGEEKVHALRDINLEIEDGEYVALMGPSGSGKSTLLNVIGCFEDRPTSGTYLLDGKDTTQLTELELSANTSQSYRFYLSNFFIYYLVWMPLEMWSFQ